MFGLVEWSEERSGVSERRILGVRFLVIHLRRGKKAAEMLRAKRGARWLRRQGVSSAVFPKDFPYSALFARHGVFPPDERGLRLAAASAAARCVLAKKRGLYRAVLVGEEVTRDLYDAAIELAMHLRYLALAVEHGGETLEQVLRRSYGVALQRCLPEQTGQGDLVLLFSKADAWQNGESLCLPLWDRDWEMSFRMPEEAEAGELEENQLLAALYAAGALRREQIELAHIPLA